MATVPVPITARWESAAGVPLVSPANVPTISIRRLDTGVEIVSTPMTEVGGGAFWYNFTPPDLTTEFFAVADGDPIANGQVPAAQRYKGGQVNSHAKETWRGLGHDPTDPMNFDNANVNSDTGEITIVATGDGETSKRLVRTT